MHREKAVEFTKQLVLSTGETINERDENILRGSWEGLTYESIKAEYLDSFDSCKISTIKKVIGYQLWQKVTNAFKANNIIDSQDKVNKLTFKGILNKYESQQDTNLDSSENDIFCDRYKILTLLRQNQISKTYLAQHLTYFDRKCIIRQLEDTANDNDLYVLEREAKILKDLSDLTVRVPKLFDWSKKENENYQYLIYESVEGTSLDEELNSQDDPITELEARALLREILEIIDCLHRCKIIHRNICPSNLIRRDRDGKLVLIEFKNAKYTNNAEDSINSHLHYSVSCYTAPEFIYAPTFASDLYSIGKIIIQALMGITPNECKRNNSDWRSQVKISPDFAEILDKMVLKDYQLRYQSAREVLNLL